MYLLDTNHCSRLIDNHPSVISKLQALGDASIATCVIVSGELIFMVERSQRKTENTPKIVAFLSDIEVFHVDEQVAEVYGKLKADLLTKYGPKPKKAREKVKLTDLGFSDNDLWIAAIAKRRGYTVVSRDGDFKMMQAAIGLRVESWYV